MDTTSKVLLQVLVADDNPVNQLVAARLVRRQGHFVQIVSNGEQALEAIRKNSFDVVLMDLGMPVMDGLEAVRELRRQEQQTGHHLPVIAMTASATDFDRDRCLKAGMDDFVSKPVHAIELSAAMSRVLRDDTQFRSEIDLRNCPERIERKNVAACDLESALKKVDGDEEFLRQLAQIFLDSDARRLESLEHAMQERDLQLISDIAHSIKGSVRYFFADAAYERAQRLEIISPTADFTLVQQAYEQLLPEVHRVHAELLRTLFASQEASPDSGVS